MKINHNLHIRTSLILAISLFFILKSEFVFCQNYYDYDHTKQFAEFLYKTGQYEFAAQELERAIFLNSTDSASELLLIKSYRFSRNFNTGISRCESILNTKKNYSQQLTEEYCKLLFLQNRSDSLFKFLGNSQQLSIQKKNEYTIKMLAQNKKWQEMINHAKLNGINYSGSTSTLVDEITKYQFRRTKSPFLAATFSTLLPGSGKIYSGFWKDGLISLLFVATNTWQSYKGFEQKGKQSGYGWIFGGLAVGFYLGNIYGSAKAAKKRNQIRSDEMLIKIKPFLDSDN